MIAILCFEFAFLPCNDFAVPTYKVDGDGGTKEVEVDVIVEGGLDRSSGGGLATLTCSQSLLLSNFLPSVNTGLERLICFPRTAVLTFRSMVIGCFFIDVVLVCSNIKTVVNAYHP